MMFPVRPLKEYEQYPVDIGNVGLTTKLAVCIRFYLTDRHVINDVLLSDVPVILSCNIKEWFDQGHIILYGGLF